MKHAVLHSHRLLLIMDFRYLCFRFIGMQSDTLLTELLKFESGEHLTANN